MNWLKLTNFELNRFAKILAVLLGLVLIIQLIGTIDISNGYMSRVNNAIHFEGLSEEQAMSMYGMISYQQVTHSLWFTGPIFIGIASVLFYIFLIWYRDWFGKNTFIYRLLMLPTERINLYLAKLTTILLITFSFISTQIISILVDMQVMKMIVPQVFRIDYSIHEVLRSSLDTGILYPGTFTEFLLYYGAGVVAVAILFTAILFERCFRLMGIVLGALYVVVAGILVFAPLLFAPTMLNNYFFTDELIQWTIVCALITLAGSVAISAYLLRKKIRV